jgi:hypothetical protein
MKAVRSIGEAGKIHASRCFNVAVQKLRFRIDLIHLVSFIAQCRRHHHASFKSG